MRKDDRINPVFLIFYIILGFILLDLLVQGVGILFFDDRVPKEQTLNYQLEQMLSDQGVPVRKKHLPEIRAVAVLIQLLHVGEHLFPAPHPELLCLVHVAEGTGIVSAADGNLQNQAARLAGRPVSYHPKEDGL